MTASVFISFGPEHDPAHCSRLAAHLAAAGIAARYDTRSTAGSWETNWSEADIKAQIAACTAVILVTSPQAQRSGLVARELEHARSLGKPILALEPGEMPGPDFLELLRPAPAEPSDLGPILPVYQGKMGTAVGIETRGGVFTPLLFDGAAVPAEVTETFTTAEDNQPSIKLRVMAGNGQLLGGYELLLDPAQRGVPLIYITFRVEQTGAFRLLARDAKGNAVPVRSPAGRA